MLSGFASDASYLGGSQSDYLGGIALGPDGALYITGQTGSVDFPTTPGPYSGPLWPFCATQLCSSGFLVKLDLTQSGQAQLAIGAVFPGQSFGGISVAVLPGSLPAVLSSQSQQFTQINPLYGFPVNAAGLLPSLVVLSDNGQSLLLASYLASDGNSNRWFDRMVTNGSGKLYVSGYTNEPGLGTAGAYQPDLAGSYDGLIRSISGIASNRPPMVDLGPPITLSQPLFSLRCGDTVPCNISDADNDPIIGYRLLGPNGLNLFSPVAPPEANLQLTVGSHSFTLLVTDNQGSVGVGSLTVAVVDSVPPVVTAPPDLQDHATEPLGARGSASPALHAFLFTSASATDALDPHPVALPPQADFGAGMVDVDDQTLFPLGSTVVTFRFRDASGTVGTAVATVTVSPNQPPYVSLTPDFTVTATSPAGALVTISAFASDLDNDPLTFVWTGAPASLTANQSPNYAQLSGVLPIGVHTISITVTDGHGGSATASVTITVLGTNTVLGTCSANRRPLRRQFGQPDF